MSACTCPSRGETPHSFDCPESQINSWRMTSETARAAKEAFDRLTTSRSIDRLLTEWRGVGRHQTITFGGAAELVTAALRSTSEARRAAADMTDDELAEALNWWHYRKSEQDT